LGLDDDAFDSRKPADFADNSVEGCCDIVGTSDGISDERRDGAPDGSIERVG
jgi:hypothetical protein